MYLNFYYSLYIISFLFLFFMSIMCFLVSFFIIKMDLVYFLEWSLFSINSVEVVYVLLFDYISLFFLSCVLFISSMVVYYSISYMGHDINKDRFLLLVLLFIISMMLMILSPNMVSILLGWDGLGLVSFCLVIYYQNVKSYNAGMLTILSNRIGDICILLSIAWLLNFSSWNLYFYLDYMKFDKYINLISFLIILAAMTKSAQIPFSAWLPAAMAAPTPVSALVHSSTLVTAGVYLIIRFGGLMNNYMLKILLILSCLTMFMSGLGANYEYDLKKIIALSTLSQLGLMMGILSIGFSLLGYFHLLTHAFFKALLFLCAGVMIHSLKDNQDIRFMGSNKFMPLIFSSFLISNLSLCGFPFLAGFYSKDLILEMLSMSNVNILIYFLFYFSVGLTVSYSFRLMWFMNFVNKNFFSLINLHGEDWIMMKSIWGLMFFSIFSGSILSWILFINLNFVFLTLSMMLMVTLVILAGVLLGIFISFSFLNYSKIMWIFMKSYFMNHMWFMSFLSVYLFNYRVLIFSKYIKKILDFGWLEYLIIINIFNNLIYYLKLFEKIQMNFLKSFIIMFIFFLYLMYVFMIL
uniref:NADH-ubiquinone oxidoreductase chain 5 n=1 Tax=Notidobia ciliaris TaxID=446507 RepID=A0A7D6W3E5_9NEOP|nr:NADH dehydrogenase subunit 5 [Notidobia ciliaris]QNV11733.1 NADH dehydrogenase subunit 5 [Notidobia ciliaris]